MEVQYKSCTVLRAAYHQHSSIADQFWTQDSANVNYAAEEDDYFGSYLSSGDFNDDGKDDLAIGISCEDLGSIVDAGTVQVLIRFFKRSISNITYSKPVLDTE
jgi:hypothetical protein